MLVIVEQLELMKGSGVRPWKDKSLFIEAFLKCTIKWVKMVRDDVRKIKSKKRDFGPKGR